MRGFQTADQEDRCNVRPGSAGGCRLLISLLFLHTFGCLCFAQSALPESTAELKHSDI